MTELQRANHNLKTLWSNVHQFYGQPVSNVPHIVRVPYGEGYAYVLNDAPPIYGNPSFVKAAAHMDPNKPSDVRYTELHELGHAELGLGEGGANHIANRISRWLNKRTQKKKR